jgi:hypothetical protein
MHRVPAEIPEEVGVLLQHGDFHAAARQQQSRHHARGTSAHDYARRFLVHRILLAASVILDYGITV